MPQFLGLLYDLQRKVFVNWKKIVLHFRISNVFSDSENFSVNTKGTCTCFLLMVSAFCIIVKLYYPGYVKYTGLAVRL